MARFKVNRLSAFILALGVSLLCCSMNYRPAVAALGDPVGNTGVIGNPTDPGGGQNGDPDFPSGNGKNLQKGASRRIGTGSIARTVGDGPVPRSVLMWRLRVVLQGWRGFYLRF